MNEVGREAPFARGLPLVGLVPELVTRGFIPMLTDQWKRHGDFFRLRLGVEDIYAVVHPDGIQRVLKDRRDNYVKGRTYDDFRLIAGNGLITLEGDAWAHRRRVAAPAFARPSVRDQTPILVSRAEAMVERWKKNGATGIDLLEEMTRLTSDIATRAFFAQTVENEASMDASARALADALEVSSKRGNTALAAPIDWPTLGNLKLKRALRQVDRLIYGIVDARRESSERPSVLERIASAVDPETGTRLDRRALRDEAVTLYIAAHETTALTLTWAFDLLSRHPEATARLVEEVRAVCGEGSPTYEQLESMPYARAVLDETLRIRPPVWSFARDVVEDDVMLGYRLPAGAMVMPLPFFTHRHPDFWDAPLAFRPERFLEERATRRHPFAYVPFSSGPRACAGMHFSVIETLATFAVVLRSVTFESPSRELELDAQVTLRPRGAAPARLRWAKPSRRAVQPSP